MVAQSLERTVCALIPTCDINKANIKIVKIFKYIGVERFSLTQIYIVKTTSLVVLKPVYY
jgi:hypothetical protein